MEPTSKIIGQVIELKFYKCFSIFTVDHTFIFNNRNSGFLTDEVYKILVCHCLYRRRIILEKMTFLAAPLKVHFSLISVYFAGTLNSF